LTYSRDHPFGGISGWTWGNGTVYSRGIDLNGRVASYPLGTTQRSLVFDEASRIVGFNDGASTQSFGYDAVSRLTSFTSNASAPLSASSQTYHTTWWATA
jgi:hypothetical protein